MKIKQYFNKHLSTDMYDMLLYAIKEGAPNLYNSLREDRFYSDTAIVHLVYNKSVDTITYSKIIEICEKYIKMKAFS